MNPPDCREPVSAVVALGANLGDAAATLRQALADIAALPHTQLLQASPLLSSAPLDADGPAYVNAVARLETRLNAVELLPVFEYDELELQRWDNPRKVGLGLCVERAAVC